MPSKSIVTVTGGACLGAPPRPLPAAPSAPPAPPEPAEPATPAAPSSSDSGVSGVGSPFFNTARYKPKFSTWSYDVMSSHCDLRPRSVDARNQRYLPLASHAGDTASDKPSLTCFDTPVSTFAT